MDGKAINNQSSNCLNLIRIIAAFQVMFGHMVEHLELPINDMLFYLTYFFRGVPIFFVLSGYLMWFSIERSNSYKNYLSKRFLRIYPELWMSVIVDLIVIVSLYSSWDIKDLALFALGQGTFFQFWTPNSLRGYGVGTPNGALWTIGVMIQFYVVAWFFYKLIKKHHHMIIWIALTVGSFVVSGFGGFLTHDFFEIEIVGKLYDQTIVKYFWLFSIGMFIAEFAEFFIPIFVKWWYVLLAFAFIFFITGFDLYSGYYLMWSVCLTSGLIGFAYRFPQLSIKLDISYAVFLYHMIIVNIFVEKGYLHNWLFLVAVMLITVIIACLSTITLGNWGAKNKASLLNIQSCV